MEATCTPRVERKVVAAGTTSSSREQVSEQLRDLADLSIDGKRCERIVLRVGRQRVAEREERLSNARVYRFRCSVEYRSTQSPAAGSIAWLR